MGKVLEKCGSQPFFSDEERGSFVEEQGADD